MSTRCPLPARASVRDLLTDLLGCEVTVGQASPFQLSEERRAMLATYRYDDDTVAAAIACELTLAASSGAAIGMMPVEEAREAAASELDDDMEEFFHEVVNVTAKLLNSPTTPHVALDEVFAVPGEVPADVAEVVLEPGVRNDYVVAIEGYIDGTMVLVTR